MAESIRRYHERMLKDLKQMRQPWEDTYRELDELVARGYYRMQDNMDPENRGNKRMPKVLDCKGTKALKIFAAGMQSGNTSKARPWFKGTTLNTDLLELPNVAKSIDQLDIRMRHVMARSNFYNVFHDKYGALGLMGTAASYLSKDDKYVVRNNGLIAGRYWIAQNALYRIDTLYHELHMSARQIAQHFNKATDNIPKAIMTAIEKEPHKMFKVYHAMEPRPSHMRDRDDKRAKHKPFISNYWTEVDSDKDRLLRESGSDINRVICTRWNRIGDDPYGYGLGMDALADIKQLQHGTRRRMEITDKVSRPPMVAPTALKNARHSLLPGAITYSDELAQSGGGYRPAIDVTRYDTRPLIESNKDLKESIDDIFHVNLFRAITSMQGIQPRNEFELAERKEERLLELGPALENIQEEELEPTLSGVYHYMKEAGIAPELADELKDDDGRSNGELNIEYTSIMAQAQKAVSTGAIERVAGYVGNLAAIDPQVMDKFNRDQSIDEYANRIGAPGSIIVSDEEVRKIRESREKQLKQKESIDALSQAAPAMKQGAEAAALMAQTDDTEGDPTRLLDELGLGGSLPLA